MSAPVSMPAPIQPIAELFARNIDIHHVYGEPVHQGDITVIPVAKVAYGFGAGAGPARGRRAAAARATAESGDGSEMGTGGGGGARITPIGALEISPRGTRFIHYRPMRPLLGAFALGVGAGLLAAARRSH